MVIRFRTTGLIGLICEIRLNYLIFENIQILEALFSPEQKLGMRSAMKLLLSAMPITIRPTFEIHYFARSEK